MAPIDFTKLTSSIYMPQGGAFIPPIRPAGADVRPSEGIPERIERIGAGGSDTFVRTTGVPGAGSGNPFAEAPEDIEGQTKAAERQLVAYENELGYTAGDNDWMRKDAKTGQKFHYAA